MYGTYKFATLDFSIPNYSVATTQSNPKIDSNYARKYVTQSARVNNFFQEKKIIAYDNSGKRAEYVLFLIKGFNWRLAEISMSEKNGVLSDVCDHLTQIGVSERINRADFKGIICFGNTSYEEDETIPKNKRKKNEEDRAEARAQMLVDCVSPVLKTKTPVFKSNVGKYDKAEEISTYQREIIIVGIVENEDKVVNEEALFNGLDSLHYLEGWEIEINEFSKVKSKRLEIDRVIN